MFQRSCCAIGRRRSLPSSRVRTGRRYGASFS
ncbi:uncharacterized protein HMPREF1541_04365 [Cyphellophora europaea CBS 101466]|uniref:Uncharacterized protein n=1 Tax=Cyphellophora europaea (strain CBS 101466) TaxID=1220924 RepID=W2RUV9_CYPE1|nr:uncharacterized protein HMPREF1541_04365 [Cyphellophora europaea CBS 101466]ETN40090.1 hypothetical protein HMPREF1541_04365 [Cyphellophora europaea CBS 101466]